MMVIPSDKISLDLADVEVSQRRAMLIQRVVNPVATFFQMTECIIDVPNDFVNIWVDTGMQPSDRG